MNRIAILIKLAIAIIPFYAFGYLLHYVFRHIPGWLSFVLNLLLLIGLIYYVIFNRKKFFEEEEDVDYLPEHLEKSTYFFLILGSFIGYFLASSSFRTTIYVDNGNSYPIEVSISEETSISIPANSFKKTSVPIGENETLINGKTKLIDVKDGGKWMFNVGSLNTYLQTTINYSNPKELYKDGKIDTTKIENSKDKIVKGEFFKIESDYVFEAPETITVDKDSPNGKVENLTVLYKLTRKTL
ncbi:hypothetical protein [Flavobacterium psychrophilum]|uniref:hypothetical protein n=1 Tax=Flavobacterium psychrophilum TaxID=96345 RepID=UPI0004D1767D|nr:hypothetical protein [Flavobacterium psychrophilum]AIG35317.1 hypothetical protein IA02_10000 [Flavobacterium psychrophilum]AIG39948.1 hypothetical protein IA05_10595 [Flavobacterium psychrophilum]AIT66318.1 hypothetical protein IB65_10815 [Flavobacterium psychrophilum]